MHILLGIFVVLFAIFQLGGMAIGIYLLWKWQKNLSQTTKANAKGHLSNFLGLMWRHKVMTIILLLVAGFLAPEIGFVLYTAFMIAAAASWGIFLFMKAYPHIKNAGISLSKKKASSKPAPVFKMPSWKAPQNHPVAPVQPTPSSMMTPAINPNNANQKVCNIVN